MKRVKVKDNIHSYCKPSFIIYLFLKRIILFEQNSTELELKKEITIILT